MNQRLRDNPAGAASAGPSWSLMDLAPPPGLPRTILAFVGENENGALRAHSQVLMASVEPWGYRGHVIDIGVAGWEERLAVHLQAGVLLAWGAAGIGAGLSLAAGSLWDSMKVPFISVLADSPCQMPRHHRIEAGYVANGYVFRDWLQMQRRFIRSPQISSLLPQGVAANPHCDDVAWSRRRNRMVLVKTGFDPERHRAGWRELPPRFRTILEDTTAQVLKAGVVDLTGAFLEALERHDLAIESRLDVLFGLMYRADQYIRDARSTALVRALIHLPVDVIGRGWDHVRTSVGRARFHEAVDAEQLPALYADCQFLLNTMPNFSHGTHERVLNGFAAKACVITNENADMRRRFGGLPSYVPISTEAEDLPDRLSDLFHTREVYDAEVQPAFDLVEAEFSAAGFMRGLIELALEVRNAAGFAAFSPTPGASG